MPTGAISEPTPRPMSVAHQIATLRQKAAAAIYQSLNREGGSLGGGKVSGYPLRRFLNQAWGLQAQRADVAADAALPE